MATKREPQRTTQLDPQKLEALKTYLQESVVLLDKATVHMQGTGRPLWVFAYASAETAIERLNSFTGELRVAMTKDVAGDPQGPDTLKKRRSAGAEEAKEIEAKVKAKRSR